MSLEPITTIAPKALEALKDPSLRWLFFPGLMKKALLNQKISELEVEQSAQEWKVRQNTDRQFLSMLENFSPEQAGLAERAHASFAAERVESQTNREAIAAKAYDFLKERDLADRPPLDSDFIKRFYSYAGDISKDDAQTVWAKLLAGEISNPGSFSLKTLDTLRNLTQEQAEAIVNLSKYIFGKGILLQYEMEEGLQKSPFKDKEFKVKKVGVPVWEHIDNDVDAINFLGIIAPKRDYVEVAMRPGDSFEFNLCSGKIFIKIETSIVVYFFYLPLSDSYYELLSLQDSLPGDDLFIKKIYRELNSWGFKAYVEVDGIPVQNDELERNLICGKKYFFCKI